ncbi:hypothetical protein K9M42_02790 [Patescibacteria group bacterium]|nr:hypothetical protein [Patescibacteria group bacterium]
MGNYIYTDKSNREWIVNVENINKFIIIRTDNALFQAKKSLKYFDDNIDKKNYRYKIVKRHYNDYYPYGAKYAIIKIFNTIKQCNKEKERNRKIGEAIHSISNL